jgi:predicted amidophosphoribosyltransferase
MIRTIAYASCYVYSPSGAGSTCEKSRLLRSLLKAGNSHFLRKYALRVRQQADESPALTGFFRAADILIPVPGSAPHSMGTHWTADELVDAMVSQGLGAAAWRGLRRMRAVRRSATSAAGKRPTVTVHYDSFAIDYAATPPESIILVDDVVTKGRTLLAAATRIREAFPRAEIRAFALLRTMGMVPSVEQLLDPCRGEIRWRAGDAHRDP